MASSPVLTVPDLAQWDARTGLLQLLPDGAPRHPLLVIDLDGTDWSAPTTRRAETALRNPSRPLVVGLAYSHLPPQADRLLRALTCTLALSEGSRTIAGAPSDLAAIEATVRQAPVAAVTLGSLLDVTSSGSVPEGLVAESLAYSSLLAGAEFAQWRRTNPVRAIPEPHDPPVLIDRQGSVLHLALNRPERRNAFGRAVRDCLMDGLELARLDGSIETVHLRANGPHFCSGGDLDEFGGPSAAPVSHLVRLHRSGGYALHRLSELGKATSVRVHGACVGAGIELPAFAASISATDDAWFRLPELSMGLIPGAGGTVSVTRRIGRWRTAWMALTGMPLDAATALRWNLVDRVESNPLRPRGSVEET